MVETSWYVSLSFALVDYFWNFFKGVLFLNLYLLIPLLTPASMGMTRLLSTVGTVTVPDLLVLHQFCAGECRCQ
jgi:hypothetical protein